MNNIRDWESEKETLKQLIEIDKISYEEIGRRYNCSGANIKKIAKRLNITLPQKRKINPSETFGKGIRKVFYGYCANCNKELTRPGKYCNIKCQHQHQHKLKYQKILDGNPSIMRANYSPSDFKEDIIKEQNGVCAICGMPQIWNNKPLVFILDHIDGHASNNKRDNLRCICPNCDSQLDTYKSKNKNGDRYYYRYGNKK